MCLVSSGFLLPPNMHVGGLVILGVNECVSMVPCNGLVSQLMFLGSTTTLTRIKVNKNAALAFH